MLVIMKFGEEPQQKKLGSVSKVGVVILSRFSSKRLPGKALLEIEGKPILKYILERVLKVVDRNNVVIATSYEHTDDAIENFSKIEGIDCYRGSLTNVSRRFFEAAKSKKFDYAIRINGDNIFVEIPLLQKVVHLSETGIYKFISNVYKRTFPKGMSVEAVKVSFYEECLPKIELDERYNEHVTLYLYKQLPDENFHFIYNHDLPEAGGIQFALDTKKDLIRVSKIISMFKKSHTNYNLKEIFKISKII